MAKTEIPGRSQGFLGCHGTTYFQRRKQIFHNYSHDFLKEEIFLHKTIRL